MDYLLTHPTVNRFYLVMGIAEGLAYLHREKVVHGDMKPNNVLVDDRAKPVLCDFGRSKFLPDELATLTIAGSTRYMAQELQVTSESDNGTVGLPLPGRTKEADVYGFSMVALEVITSRVPFCNIQHDSTVVYQVMKGYRPGPDLYGFNANAPVWQLLTRCWNVQANARPTMETVVEELKRL